MKLQRYKIIVHVSKFQSLHVTKWQMRRFGTDLFVMFCSLYLKKLSETHCLVIIFTYGGIHYCIFMAILTFFQDTETQNKVKRLKFVVLAARTVTYIMPISFSKYGLTCRIKKEHRGLLQNIPL